MKCLAILGGSGHGKVLAEIAELQGWDEIHFFDDNWPEKTENGPWNVIGNSEQLLSDHNLYQGVIVAIGNNLIRLEKVNQLEAKLANLVSLIHPSAVVSKYAKFALGSVVMANAVINPFVSIGKACIVNSGATIDHDCVLADAVHVSPGANLAGGVTVGTCSWIGAGAAVRQLVSIGDNVVVGLGAAVVTDLVSDNQFVGVPAKPLTGHCSSK